MIVFSEEALCSIAALIQGSTLWQKIGSSSATSSSILTLLGANTCIIMMSDHLEMVSDELNTS